MQNNQPSLQEYLFYDLNEQYKPEDHKKTGAKDSFEDLDDDEDCFSESYAELDFQNNSSDNSILNQSQPYTINNYDNESTENGNNFLNTTINYASYDEDDDYSQEEDNEIHYLNFIRKSEIAVSQKNLLENRSNRYSNFEEEENTKAYTIVCIDDSKSSLGCYPLVNEVRTTQAMSAC